MENGIFAYILRYSRKQQLKLLLMIIASFPFYYLSLDLPKTIINEAIGGIEFPVTATFDIFGLQLYFGTYEQIPYLLLLCLAFLMLVIVNGLFKLFINIYRGLLGERMLRRMRLQLINRIMEFPLARFRRTSQGELVSMVNQETEPLGGFIGESISLPLYQGGLLLTILTFMFVQDWRLGLASIALYPVQAWLIPKLQRQINLLNQERTLRIRSLSENLGEVVAGINEVHANNNLRFYDHHFSILLGVIYFIRIKIYKKKFLIKFLNNSFAQITPFFFFLIGGVLVIQGNLSIGALVAALAAYKDLSPPWKELLSWYQGQADARLRYSVLVEQFQQDESDSASDPKIHTEPVTQQAALPMVASRVSFTQNNRGQEINSASLTIESGDWISLVGASSSGKGTMAQLCARLIDPTDGKLQYANQDSTQVPRAATTMSIAYVGHDSYVFSGTVRSNLLQGLKQQPQTNLSAEGHSSALVENVKKSDWEREAGLSGNSDLALDTDWIDYEKAGVDSPESLSTTIATVLNTVGAADDIIGNALSQKINSQQKPELVKSILEARHLFKEQIMEQGLGSVVEFLDPEQYNDNATLAENILFGISDLAEFSIEGLTHHPVLRELLKEYDLADALDNIAFETAKTLCELFMDLPSDHEFFSRYDLVNAEDLEQFDRILRTLKKRKTITKLVTKDKVLIRSISFKLVSGRHRLDMLSDDMKQRVVKLRKKFTQKLDDNSRSHIDRFSPDRYNSLVSIRENIIFGRIVYGRLGSHKKVQAVILNVLQSLNLMPPIYEVGISAKVGLAGSLLSVTQRQKLALARGLLKRPELLVIHEGLNATSTEETHVILSNIKEQHPNISVLWVDNDLRFTDLFDKYAYFQSGKLDRIEEPSSKVDLAKENDSDEPRQLAKPASEETRRVLKVLDQIPLFAMLDTHQLHLLARGCESVTLPEGERLFAQGDVGDALYVVVDGIAGVFRSKDGIETKVGEYGTDEVIGELALLSDNPRWASVDALSKLSLLKLKRHVFLETIRSNGEIGYQILQVVSNRFSSSNPSSSNNSIDS